MNTAFYIARRSFFDKRNRQGMAYPVVRIVTAGITLGIVLMMISLAVLTGFKTQIRNKVIGFGGHITITAYDSNNSFESNPIEKNQFFYPDISVNDGIEHIQIYATKPAIIKTPADILGVVLKGVGTDFDWSFFEENMVEGKTFRVLEGVRAKEAVISKSIADKMQLRVGDKLQLFFVQDPPRSRNFVISGIYSTGLEEFDRMYVLADIGHIQHLNAWKSSQVGGFEVLVSDYDRLEQAYQAVFELVGNRFDDQGNRFKVNSIRENAKGIFDWLDLSDMNVVVILVIIAVVIVMVMLSGLLVIVLEHTNQIGVLKALGASDTFVTRVFLYNGFFIFLRALILGNAISIIFCLVQEHFKLIPLDPESYFISFVPANLLLWHVLLVNAATLLLVLLASVVPSLLIARTSPDKAIRFN